MVSITDELREWIDGLYTPNSSTLKMEGERIADRIDAAHERAMADAWLAAMPTDSQMAELGYAKLPVDADGVPIHVGNKIEYLSGGRDIVRFITLNDNGWLVNERGWEPYTMRHHCVQTVEDVLREFARECDADAYGITDAKVAEFAAKLRLADGVDE